MSLPKPKRPAGNATHNGFALLVVERVGHRRFDEAGGHAIDGDVARGDLLGQRFRHADQAGLRRRSSCPAPDCR